MNCSEMSAKYCCIGTEKAYTRSRVEGKKFLGKGESIPDDTDALLLSPSVPLNRPLVKACKEKNIPVMGELELGYIRSKCRVVAVTGTNGKTTTVSLINHILRSAGRSSYALGNIGVPFCSMCEKLGEEDIAVLEASSFQLEAALGLRRT